MVIGRCSFNSAKSAQAGDRTNEHDMVMPARYQLSRIINSLARVVITPAPIEHGLHIVPRYKKITQHLTETYEVFDSINYLGDIPTMKCCFFLVMRNSFVASNVIIFRIFKLKSTTYKCVTIHPITCAFI